VTLRERIALRIAPSLYVPYRHDRDEAFKDLAEIAYLSRDAVWTSPRVLVKTALAEHARRENRELRAALERYRERTP
jgi:hypothetical protein